MPVNLFGEHQFKYMTNSSCFQATQQDPISAVAAWPSTHLNHLLHAQFLRKGGLPLQAAIRFRGSFPVSEKKNEQTGKSNSARKKKKEQGKKRTKRKEKKT